jgi:glycosyltransferase involved in cell wall biosynthesis
MENRIHVIIDARMIDENLHGIARYTYELIKNSVKTGRVYFSLLVNDIKLAEKMFESVTDIDFIVMKSKFLSLTEQLELPKIVNRYCGKAIFHSPSFVSSPFIKNEMIMTIHDLNHVRLPQFYSPFHKYYYKYIVRYSAKKCNIIFTVSEFSKQEILSWIDLKDENVIVTYNGIGDRFKVIDDLKQMNKVKIKYNLPEKFLLYVGNLKPHKNVETLIKSMRHVKLDDEIKLVVGGNANDSLMSIIKEYNLENRVRFIGFIDEEDLVELYNMASLFVFPSLYEGFGLPPLEAMSCGCPSIVANTSSLPEVIGDGGIVFEAINDVELAEKIDYLFNDNKKCSEYIDYGINRAKAFTWGKLVEETISQYEKIWASM